jgi:zinc protease
MRARAPLWLSSLLLLLLLPAPAPGEALKVEIKEWKLKNGMRVLYSPHRRVPAVTVQVWYHAGSKDERVGLRGIAHMFEHMMFKGSEHVPPEEHARMLSAIGGSTNAFTAEDLTAYHDTVPRQYMGFAMKLEAERMRHLHLTLHTIKSEREVVKEEKRVRLENNPIGRALEAIYALAYTKHPYAWTPAGVIADLNQMKRANYQRFYDTYYVPENATLIVVGDVSEAEVRRAAEEHFSPIPRGKEPPRVTVREPPQTEMRVKNADWPSQLVVVLGAYHIPAASHPDIAPLQVLSAILSAGRSSRLHQALVRKGKLAVAAGGFVSLQEHPGVLMAYGIGLPGADGGRLTKIKEALLRQLELVGSRGVRPAELEKARNQLATARLSRIRTLTGLANQIGMSAILKGDPRAFLKEVAALDRVTAADVRRVAKRYLQPKNLSLVLVDAKQARRSSTKGGDR